MTIDIPMYLMCDGSLGCDCKKLRKQNKQRLRKRPPQHGTRRMWQNGCTCQLCEVGNKAYMAGYSAGRRAEQKEKTDDTVGNSGLDSGRAA